MLVKQKIKYIQSLGQKKFRESEKCFIAEGPKLMKDLLEADPAAIIDIYATPGWLEENEELVNADKVTLITPEELQRLSQLITPNKVIAIVKQFDRDENIVTKNNITLVLDNIQDPGNFGTIIRIADWFGVKQVVASESSVDLYNPKVVQSTMGSIARVAVHYHNLEEWLLNQSNIQVYATALEGRSINSMEKIKEGIIIIGNESRGVNQDLLELSTVNITIPRIGNAESLNAAVATGIILSHLV